MKKPRISNIVSELWFAVYRIVPRFTNIKNSMACLYSSLVGTDRLLTPQDEKYVQKVKWNTEAIKEDIEHMEKMLVLLQDSTKANEIAAVPKQLYRCVVCFDAVPRAECLVSIQGLACPSCGSTNLKEYILKE